MPILGRVVPELRERFPEMPIRASSGEPSEDRIQLARAMTSWMEALTALRPVVITVDDAQRCDEASAASLASLAHATRSMPLTLLVAVRSDEPARAPHAISALKDAGRWIRLRGLSSSDVEQLVRSLFGDAPHAASVAEWMHRLAGGCPLHCTELARHLVDGGLARYSEGTWILPRHLEDEELPRGLAEAMDARVRALSPGARALGEVLGVRGGQLDLELCVALAEEPDEAAVFAALDELVFEEVLVGAGGTYAFRHDGHRESLLRGLSEERRRRLHLRAAEALTRSVRVDPEVEADVGWHFLHGGDAERGAQYLLRAGRRLYAAHSFRDALPMLEAALEVLERGDASPELCLELRQMLVRAGVMCDRGVLLRYAGETLDRLRVHAGLSTADRLRPVLGARIGVMLGIAWAWLRRAFTRRRRRGPGPITALTGVIAMANFAASAYSLAFDTEPIRRLVGILAPLSFFRGRILGGAVLLAENFHHIAVGQFQAIRDNAEQLLETLTTDRWTPISDLDRRMGIGGTLFMRASAAALDQDPSFEDDVRRLIDLDLGFFEAAATMDHVFYRLLRGEVELAAAEAAKADVYYLQMGNAWVMESQNAWISTLACGLTRDVLGLKRGVDEVERLIEAGYRLEPFRDLAVGEYLRERGDTAGSREVLRALLDGLDEEQLLVRQLALPALAETHLAAGDVDEAVATAEAGLAMATDPAIGMTTARCRCARALALAEAARGDTGAAAERIDRLLEELSELRSPVINGGLHEARARVALLAGDELAFQEHRRHAEELFRSSANPALIAITERLAASAGRASGEVAVSLISDAVTVVDRSDPRGRVNRSLRGARGQVERASLALQLLMDETSAQAGVLLMPDETGLSLVAPVGATLDEDLARDLREIFDTARSEQASTLIPQRSGGGDSLRKGRWMAVVLMAQEGSRMRGVAIAAVRQGAVPLSEPDARLVEAVARRLGDGASTDGEGQAPDSSETETAF